MKYLIVIEKSENGYGAYPPDLPGVGVVGDTVEEVRQLAQEAIAFHLEGLHADGDPIPQPTTRCEYVEVSTARAAA